MTVKLSWAALVVLALAGPAPSRAQRPMTPVDLLDVPQLGEPRLSPDGRWLLYVLAEADWKANKRIRHIWRIPADGGEPVQMTGGTEGQQSPRWSPDGTRIAFLAKRGDDEESQVYLIANRGGEARRLRRHETAVEDIQWSPDGRLLYFLAREAKSEEQKKREEAQDDITAFDQDYRHRHLWRVDVDAAAPHRVTEGDFSVRGYRLARDGTRIAFHRAPTPLFDDSDEGEVWVMDADGTNAVRLTHNTVAERGAELSPDNSAVLFVSDSNEEFETYYNDNLFLVPARGGEHRLLLPEMPHAVTSASWSADGKSIYFVANTGVRSELFTVDAGSEELRQLTRGDHALGHWTYVPAAERHVFILDQPANAGDVWTLAAEADATPRRLTHVFDPLAEEFLLPRQEAIRWPGADGQEVEGLLFYPVGYEAGKAYPLVVQTHGGPAASDKFGFGYWNRYVPILTAMGYAVLSPNYRGSKGYGDAFLRDMVGHYYRQSHLDVMTGVDHLVKLGIADGERMVKMGWSAGGHMTNKIITHTDRFKAASSGAGAVNWVSMYGQSDVRIYRTPWFGGTPWQKNAPIDVYWAHSPLSEIHKVKTPTLVLVGENDVRVPPPQSVELHRALKANGVPTRLYVAPREPHGWRELRHQLFKVNVELEWFEKYAMGREYEWAEAPVDEATSAQRGLRSPEGGSH